MNISSVKGSYPATSGMEGLDLSKPLDSTGTNGKSPEVARQFEAILVRQILTESMKSMLENGKSGQVYGYFLTDALAEGITKGGGIGLRSVLEAQLRLRDSDEQLPLPQ